MTLASSRPTGTLDLELYRRYGDAPWGYGLGPEGFWAEMLAAHLAEDRAQSIAHLRRALGLRPVHPLNLVLKFDLAVHLTQDAEPGHATTSIIEALALCEDILREYDPKDYYEGYSGAPSDAPVLFLPRAAIMAASIYTGLMGNTEQADRCVRKAMDIMKWLYDTRRQEWATAPEPRLNYPATVTPGELELARLQRRIDGWKDRRRRAAEGSVFEGPDMEVVEAAVRQFGFNHGPQRPADVPAVMRQVMEAYPNTPMAFVAQSHIDRSGRLTTRATSSPTSRPQELRTAATPPERSAFWLMVLLGAAIAAASIGLGIWLLRPGTRRPRPKHGRDVSHGAS